MKGKKKKHNGGTSVNSKLLRKPIQRCFLLFLAPTFLAFCIGFIYPFLRGIYLSFCKFVTIGDASFVGFRNYIDAFNDASFIHAFWYTALYAIVSLFLINILAFAIAYLLTLGIKGANLFRTAFFMPNLIGGIVLGYTWQTMINAFLARYGTTLVADAKYGFIGLIILMNWQMIGYMMIIYIAGLQNVPTELIEAAKIDGANKWQTLKNVTIPMVMPSITICLFLTLSNSFKLFDQNLALTNGAPMHNTEMLALNIVNSFYGRVGFEGVGQAKAVMFFVIVACIALAQLYYTRNKEVEQ